MKTSKHWKKRRERQSFQRAIWATDERLGHTRSCVGCTVCCEVVGVRELKKDRFTKCMHQCEHGCGIYAERPASCAGFVCLWRNGGLGKRPDKQGFMVDFGPDGLCLVYEGWPGACETDENKRLIDDIAHACGDLLFARYGDRNNMRWWINGRVEQRDSDRMWEPTVPANVRRIFTRVPLAMIRN